jgi:Family of unknown function (DUF5681)
MAAKRKGSKKARQKRTNEAASSDVEYRVGPGRPPKEYQFKPGESGNPKGAKRKTTLLPDLKELFERALSKSVTLRQGEKEKIVTKAAAGIEQLVNQFAKGDRHARRDLIILANQLGINLTAGQSSAFEKASQAEISAKDEELLADYFRHNSSQPNQVENAKNLEPLQSDESEETRGQFREGLKRPTNNGSEQ